MSCWVILSARHEGRGADRRRVFVRCPEYQEFASHAAARRALMEDLDPDLKGASDEHIRRHWQAWLRNVRIHRIERA